MRRSAQRFGEPAISSTLNSIMTRRDGRLTSSNDPYERARLTSDDHDANRSKMLDPEPQNPALDHAA